MPVPRAESALTAPPPAFRVSLHDMQALAEALTTSKAMVGRRLLSCSDLSCRFCPNWIKDRCNDIVKEITATWSGLVDAAKDATRAIENQFDEFKKEAARLAREAAAAAEKKFNEFKAEAERLAREAEAAFNEFKAEANQFIEDVGNAFSELGDEIQCAHPPPPPATPAFFYPRLSPPVTPGVTWQECL